MKLLSVNIKTFFFLALPFTFPIWLRSGCRAFHNYDNAIVIVCMITFSTYRITTLVRRSQLFQNFGKNVVIKQLFWKDILSTIVFRRMCLTILFYQKDNCKIYSKIIFPEKHWEPHFYLSKTRMFLRSIVSLNTKHKFMGTIKSVTCGVYQGC